MHAAWSAPVRRKNFSRTIEYIYPGLDMDMGERRGYSRPFNCARIPGAAPSERGAGAQGISTSVQYLFSVAIRSTKLVNVTGFSRYPATFSL